MKPLELGVCTWSIDRHDCLRGIEVAGGELDVRVVQIGFFTQNALDGADATAIRRAADLANVEIAGVFVAFEDEDYASIERIAETGGYTPDGPFPRRLAATEQGAKLAAALSCGSVAVHAGTIPSDAVSPRYALLLDRIGQAADAAAGHGVDLLLETGREPAATLDDFVAALARGNVGVNFDPGNFVLYGTDDAARAVSCLAGRIVVAHLKDAACSSEPGSVFGQSRPLGTGDAQIPRVISKLRARDYRGPLLIERSGPPDLVELKGAVAYARTLLA